MREKWTSVWIIKTMATPMPAWEKEMNKIAHIFLQKSFKFQKRDVFKEHSRIRLATIYIHHTSIHMHILIWLYDSTLF